MFNPDLENTFVSFGPSHVYAVVVVFSIIALLIVNQQRIRNSKYVDVLRYTLATLIILQEISLNVYRAVIGEWSIATSLPLHLCGLGVLSTAIILITKSEKLFQSVFFIMLIGAVMALLTPAIDYNLGFPHYRYFQFFTSHGLIAINFTFILFIFNYQKNIRYRHVLYNFVSLMVIAVVILGIDLLVDGNYMYLMGKPGEGTALDIFGAWPWYILNIFLFGLPVFFHVFYLPFFIRDFRRKRRVLA